MEDEPIINESQSIAIIHEMIEKVKNSYIEDGIISLFWGGLVSFCSLFLYAEIKLHFSIHFDIFLLTFIALIPSVIYSIRKGKSKKYKSLNDNIQKAVWFTFFMGMVFGAWYNSTTHQDHIPLFIFLYGMPTFITGIMYKFKPMIIGGIVAWICGFASCLITQSANVLLLMALSAIAAWLIPGIILRRKYLRLVRRGNV